jgi:protein gp37
MKRSQKERRIMLTSFASGFAKRVRNDIIDSYWEHMRRHPCGRKKSMS